MPLTFLHPWALLALAALPAFFLLARWSRSGLERGRSGFVTALRALLYIALVFALAGAQWTTKSRRVATIFVVDRSFSVPADVAARAEGYVKKQLASVPAGDRAGAVVFGGEAMLELTPTEHPTFDSFHAVIPRGETDVAAALRLALAAFPEGYQRRIVLMTDGNENRGDAITEAEAAASRRTVVDVFPFHYENPAEVWVESVHVPLEVEPREPYELTVVVRSQSAGPATLRVLRNGQLVATEMVELDAGKNVFRLPQKVEAAGGYAYEVLVEAAGDTIPQNNQAHAYSNVRGESLVLLCGGDPTDTAALRAALAQEGIAADAVEPEDLPARLADLSLYDAVVFANVNASRVPPVVMEAIDGAVHDTGLGFVMIGGEDAFGPGGWRGTRIEEVLPVTMEQPQRRILPNGALVIILHTCEIGQGNMWAREISLAALRSLSPRDYFGVLYYGYPGGETWLFQPTPVSDAARLATLIRGAQPGDMPAFDTTMSMAHQGLLPVSAATKHVVVISDADPTGPSQQLVANMVNDGITISTVAIFPHSNSDVQNMRNIANFAGGRFYNVTDPSSLPQIFIREAVTLQRTMIIEQTFTPAVAGASQALTGIPADEIPPLHGYVLTNPKPLAATSLTGLEGDAILTEWTYGVGRAVAWTSDAKGRWASDWVAWPLYRKLWSQVIRSSLRSVPRGAFQTSVDFEGGQGHVAIDAIDPEGRYDASLTFRGSAAAPDGRRHELRFRQTGPGRYEATFDARTPGTYALNVGYESPRGDRGFISQGVPLSYAEEYRALRTNAPLLARIRDVAGGRELRPEDNVYLPLPAAVGTPKALWPWLILALLIAFPLDIAVRRIAIEWSQVTGVLASLRRRPKPVAAPSPELQALLRKKQEVRAETLAKPGAEPVPLEPGAPPPPSRPAAAGPAREEPKPAAPPPSDSEYLKRLLDAKKRARPGGDERR